MQVLKIRCVLPKQTVCTVNIFIIQFMYVQVLKMQGKLFFLPTKMLQEFGRDMEYGKMLFLFLWFGSSTTEELKNCFKYD